MWMTGLDTPKNGQEGARRYFLPKARKFKPLVTTRSRSFLAERLLNPRFPREFSQKSTYTDRQQGVKKRGHRWRNRYKHTVVFLSRFL